MGYILKPSVVLWIVLQYSISNIKSFIVNVILLDGF